MPGTSDRKSVDECVADTSDPDWLTGAACEHDLDIRAPPAVCAEATCRGPDATIAGATSVTPETISAATPIDSGRSGGTGS